MFFNNKKNNVFLKDIAKFANEFSYFDFTYGINAHTLKIKIIQDYISSDFTFLIYDVTDPNRVKLFVFSQESFESGVQARNKAMDYLQRNFDILYDYFEKLGNKF